MDINWIYTSGDPILQTLAGSFLILVIIILLTRIIGLRSFAKFTAYDFAFTIAIGSIISSTLTSETTIVHGGTAIAGLLILTFLSSYLQRKFPKVDQVVSNSPLSLMDGENILEKNLHAARIEKKQLLAKLREANVLNYQQVIAVVLESTGDISVLHKREKEEDHDFDLSLLDGVKRVP